MANGYYRGKNGNVYNKNGRVVRSSSAGKRGKKTPENPNRFSQKEMGTPF